MIMIGLPRRALLATAAILALPRLAQAAWPDRPIRLIVPFAPGGGTDTTARIVAQALTERLGQSVVVENRAGAGGAIGMAQAAQAPPDGNTLVMGHVATHVVNMAVQANPGYDTARDFVTLGITSTAANILELSAQPVTPLALFHQISLLALEAALHRVELLEARVGQRHLSLRGAHALAHHCEFVRNCAQLDTGGAQLGQLRVGRAQLRDRVLRGLKQRVLLQERVLRGLFLGSHLFLLGSHRPFNLAPIFQQQPLLVHPRT
jgi:hypothetical protein